MVSKIMLKFFVSGMVAGGERKKPKHVMNDDDGQFSMSWLSTPKYPKGNDNGASDDCGQRQKREAEYERDRFVRGLQHSLLTLASLA